MRRRSCGGDPSNPRRVWVHRHLRRCSPRAPDRRGPTTTTLSGKVSTPPGVHPLYNALVYIPNDPSDPGLQPFPAGITCDVCGATAAGDPLVSAYTAPDGTFTLTHRAGRRPIPLVIQLGRWRRQFTIDVATPCGANSIPDKTLTMPKNHAQGDIPRIAILTGALDPVECVLRRWASSRASSPTRAVRGHINSTWRTTPAPTRRPRELARASIPSTPGQDALFAATGGPGGRRR